MNIHGTDRWSLWTGLLFLSFVVWWLLGTQLDADMPTVGLIFAGGLIMFGIFGLIGSLRPRRAVEPVSTPPLDSD
jgi:hypothetical protein